MATREARYHLHLRGSRTTFAELVARYESSVAFLKLKADGQRSREQNPSVIGTRTGAGRRALQ
jgi:hypothetical protein